MTAGSRGSFDLPEQQQAFVGLLTRPLLTPDVDPELHRLVSRHRGVLRTWADRLGYRLVSVGSVFRLRRVPIDHVVAAPAVACPPRRELVLALVAAAALEDLGDDVTIQQLSDAVRDAGALGPHTAYDPERRADRVTLVRALGRLGDLGVLDRRTTREELLREWESSGRGPGAGYRVNRDALLLLVDPSDVSSAARAATIDPGDTPSPADPGRDPRSATILRRLVETQGLLVRDLSAGELDYWRTQHGRLLARACEMTGASAEVRREGVVLVLASDGPYTRAATVDFPAVTAAAWVSLHLVDAAATFAASAASSSDGGPVHWPSELVDAAAAGIFDRFGERLTVELRTGPQAVRATAEAALAEAGLLEVTPEGHWLVSPLGGRYRAAQLDTEPRGTTPTLDEISG